MKYLGITFGRLVDGFCILPSIDLTWATLTVKDKLSGKLLGNYATYYDLRFTWLFWYFTIGQIKNKLKEEGYY